MRVASSSVSPSTPMKRAYDAEAATPLCWVHGMPKDGLSLNRASRTRVNQENAVRKAEAKASWDRMVAGRQARAFANARSNAGA